MNGWRSGQSDGHVFLIDTSVGGNLYLMSKSNEGAGAFSLSDGVLTPVPAGMCSTRISITGGLFVFTTSMMFVTMFRLDALSSFTKSHVCWNSNTPPRPQITPAG